MPKMGFPLVLAVAASLALPAEAKRGCSDHLREIKRLYNARDPALLTANILEPGCTPKELYQAAYYQGFGFYFVGRYKDALTNFQLARGLTGPWDEQILQYIWIIQGKLGEVDAQSKTLEEFREDFPKSRKLAEMETAERRAVRTSFDGLATGGFGWLLGDRSYQGARSQGLLGGSWTQTRGGHSISEYANLSGLSSLEGRDRWSYGIEGGGLYRGPSLSAQAEVGVMRSLYQTAVIETTVTAAPETLLPLERGKVHVWELLWSGNLAKSFKRPGGWTWTANASLFKQGSSFSSAGLTWEMERRVGLRTLTLDLTSEVQEFGLETACVSNDAGGERCGTKRFAVVEAVVEGVRATGRHTLGADLHVAWEEGLGSPAFRRLAAAGLSYGLRLFPGVKLNNSLDFGWEWIEDQDEAVLGLRTYAAWLF